MKLSPYVSQIFLLVTVLHLAPTHRALAGPGRWVTVAPMPTARFGLVAAVSYLRPRGETGCHDYARIYAIGGLTVDAYASSVVEAYDPQRNQWKTVASMLTPRLFAAAATAPDGRIYVFGGRVGSTDALASVEVYDPRLDRWQYVSPLPTPCAAAAAALGPDRRIYVIGGVDVPHHYLDSVQVYDPVHDSWSLAPPMPTHRDWAGATLGAGGRIFVIDGSNEDWGHINSLNVAEGFSTLSRVWNGLAPDLVPRVAPAVVASLDRRRRIFVMGGNNSGGYMNTVTVYDYMTNTWSFAPPMPTARGALAAVLGPHGRIYAIGGTNFGLLYNTVEVYIP